MKSTNPELDHIELIFFEKLMNFVQIIATVCLGLSYFLPLYTSARGDIEYAGGEWWLFFWPVPVLVLIYISNHWLKAVFYFFLALGSLPVLFLLYFLVTFKSTPLVGYYVAQMCVIVLVVCWLILIVTTLKAAKICRTETETQAKIKTILRRSLLGIFIALAVYQVGWSILFKAPAGAVIDYELPPYYDEILWTYIDRYMHTTSVEDNNPDHWRKEGSLITIVSMPSFIDVDEEKIHAQIRSGIGKYYSSQQAYDTKLIYKREAIIRGQQVPLLFYKGTNESGAPMKQLFSGVFIGKENRKVILFITGEEAMWNQKEIDTFIKSIK